MVANSFTNGTNYDVFISYADENKKITDAMCHYLEEQKIRCWIAPRDIWPGQDFAQAIVHAIKRIKIFVLVCSNHSLQSQYVRRETNLAVSEGKIIIPFKIDRCSLDGTPMQLYLTDRHWIDAVPKPEEAFGDLAAAITAFLDRTQNIGNQGQTQVFTAQSSPEKQYGFDGTFYSKEQILKIAKFLPVLSFFVLAQILIFLSMIPYSYFKPESNVLKLVIGIPLLATLFLPMIFFVLSRSLQKKSIVVSVIIAPFLFFLWLISPAILLYEIGNLKKILRAAGLKTSFWGVPKSEITRFVDGSLS